MTDKTTDMRSEPHITLDVAPCEPLAGSVCADGPCAHFDKGRCIYLWHIEVGNDTRLCITHCDYYLPPAPKTAKSDSGATKQESK